MNLSRAFFFFKQNNSFSGVFCIPMDGLSPLLTLLCVCVGGGWLGKREGVSESSGWGDGRCLKKVMLQVCF